MDGNTRRPFVTAWSLLTGVMFWIVSGCGTGKESEYRSYSQIAREGATDSTKVPAPSAESTSRSDVGPSRANTEAKRDFNADTAAGEHATTIPATSPGVVSHAPKAIPEKPPSGFSRAENQLGDVSGTVAKPQRGNQQDRAAIAATADSSGKTTTPPEVEGNAVALASNIASQPFTGNSGRAPVIALRPGEKPKPREVKLLVPFKDFRKEGPEDAIRVSYDDIDLLKVLNMEPVTPEAPKLMPSWLKELDGKRIRIRGFMYPPHAETGLEHFVLARDNQICCFGRDPKIYDVFGVKLREGVTTDYIQSRPFDVVGVFHILPDEIEGELIRLYEIDDAVVIEKIK